MLSVLKIGGSVLRDEPSFASVARTLASRLAESGDERLVVIVSAEYGATDTLLAEARAIAGEPDPAALDLLWSTGELRSVARLTLHLRAQGVAAVPFNVTVNAVEAKLPRSVASIRNLDASKPVMDEPVNVAIGNT